MSDIHDAILKVIAYSPKPMAIHEMTNHPLLRNYINHRGNKGVSEGTVATRLSDDEIKLKTYSSRR